MSGKSSPTARLATQLTSVATEVAADLGAGNKRHRGNWLKLNDLMLHRVEVGPEADLMETWIDIKTHLPNVDNNIPISPL